MWEDPVEVENFEFSDSHAVATLKEVLPSAPSLKIMPSPQEEINLSESDKPAVSFTEENATKDNTDIFQGSIIVSSRPVTRIKAKQAPTEEVEM